MQVKYRNDMYTNYLLMEIPFHADLQTYAFKMIEKNQIKGVLPAKVRMEDGRGYLYLDIGNKRNLVEIYKDKEMDLEEMTKIFQGLLPILEELRNYLLTEKMIYLDPQYIFEQEDETGYCVVILPWQDENPNFRKMAEFFLEKINQKDENGVNAAYHFYRQQSQEPFSLYHFMPVLEKENILKRQKKHKEEIPCIPKPQEWKIEEVESNPQVEVREQENNTGGGAKYFILVITFLGLAAQFFQPIPNRIKISCLAVSLLSFLLFLSLLLLKKDKKKEEKPQRTEPIEEEWEVGETLFFESQENEEEWKLQWKERGRLKQSVIDSFPCKIGKIKEEVSIVISDVSVSRIHCQLIKRENKIAIMDLNSTNGTCLNGIPLKNGEIIEIEKNDEILVGKVKILVV